MKTKSIFLFLFTFCILLFISGCDEAKEALEWKQKYNDLNVKYAELLNKYKQIEYELNRNKDKLKEYELNSNRYIENTKKMLEE